MVKVRPNKGEKHQNQLSNYFVSKHLCKRRWKYSPKLQWRSLWAQHVHQHTPDRVSNHRSKNGQSTEGMNNVRKTPVYLLRSDSTVRVKENLKRPLVRMHTSAPAAAWRQRWWRCCWSSDVDHTYLLGTHMTACRCVCVRFISDSRFTWCLSNRYFCESESLECSCQEVLN